MTRAMRFLTGRAPRLPRACAVGVLCAATATPAGAGQQPAEGTGFVSAGPAAVVQFQEPDFGGYFCCEAGGTGLGFLAEGGWFVSRRVSIRGELSSGLPFTDDLRAPRFVQQNQHHDWIVSGGAAWHARPSSRIGIAVLAGFGVAIERTTRTSRLLRFVPPADVVPGEPFVQQATEAVPAATFGMELPIAAGRHVWIVPQARARFLWRDEVSRFQDGLGRWMLVPAAAVRVVF
jgi:hypothetical protein